MMKRLGIIAVVVVSVVINAGVADAVRYYAFPHSGGGF